MPPIDSQVNALYSVLHANTAWVNGVLAAINTIFENKSVADPLVPRGTGGFQLSSAVGLFVPLSQLLQEYLSRFSDAVVKSPALADLVDALLTRCDEYERDLLNSDPAYSDDPLAKADVDRRRYVVHAVKQCLVVLPKIMQRSQAQPFKAVLPTPTLAAGASPGVLAVLRATFQPPGALRETGARHDNDHDAIQDIKILPTHAELVSKEVPFVPANLPAAPHHLEGMERQLDIVFRLMREDFVGPLRAAIQSLLDDCTHLSDPRNALNALLQRGGGRYRPQASVTGDSSDLTLITGVEYRAIDLGMHELRLRLGFRPPPSFKANRFITRSLARGNLVGLIDLGEDGPVSRIKLDNARIHLGLVAEDYQGSQVEVVFFDENIHLTAISQLAQDRKAHQGGGNNPKPRLFLVELSGFLMSTVEPFLKALQRLSAPTIPFASILAAEPPAPGTTIHIEPPLYARNPGFAYDLSSVLTDKSAPGTLTLNVNDPESIAHARDELRKHSKLDPSQATALVDCLQREVAIVEGPPGTGKSWLGVELVRVLLAAKVGKILILAVTNHAADQTLEHIYHSVTKSIVRVGSRSDSEIMSDLSLYNLSRHAEQLSGQSKSDVGRLLGQRKEIEKEIERVCKVASARDRLLLFSHFAPYAERTDSPHLYGFDGVPASVASAIKARQESAWSTVSRKAAPTHLDRAPEDTYGVWDFWRECNDFAVFALLQDERRAEQAQLEQQGRDAQAKQGGIIAANPFDLLRGADVQDDDAHSAASSSSSLSEIDFVDAPDHAEFVSVSIDSRSSTSSIEPLFEDDWEEPTTDRPIEELMATADVWGMSRVERARLVAYYAEQIVQSEAPELAHLRRRLDEVNASIKNLNNAAKLAILRDAKIVGATTNGSANILDLISNVQPTVVLVERAGECLEAQIVANLVGSVQHLIMIGDHLQLRPHITSYTLSMDSSRGAIHRHDLSLFERLATLPIPMPVLHIVTRATAVTRRSSPALPIR
ncbi:hypothetical protein JCM10207_002529 [Rhodosporidiobolus poonsookiae]